MSEQSWSDLSENSQLDRGSEKHDSDNALNFDHAVILNLNDESDPRHADTSISTNLDPTNFVGEGAHNSILPDSDSTNFAGAEVHAEGDGSLGARNSTLANGDLSDLTDLINVDGADQAEGDESVGAHNSIFADSDSTNFAGAEIQAEGDESDDAHTSISAHSEPTNYDGDPRGTKEVNEYIYGKWLESENAFKDEEETSNILHEVKLFTVFHASHGGPIYSGVPEASCDRKTLEKHLEDGRIKQKDKLSFCMEVLGRRHYL